MRTVNASSGWTSSYSQNGKDQKAGTSYSTRMFR